MTVGGACANIRRVLKAMFRLDDKVALVTGAASGIGRAIARCFAQAGAHVVIVDRNESEGRRAAASICDAGGRAAFHLADVSDERQCREAAGAVLGAHGRCDVLVNNAGIGHVGTVLSTSGDDLDMLYRVNVRGIHNMSAAVLPSMVQHRCGSVINMASIAGIVAVRERYAYTMTKFAVVGLTKSMALDLAESRVRVNCICPARVETPWIRQRLKEYPDPQQAYRDMCRTQLLGRMGRPGEIAAAALYLASDEAAFVTGSCLLIDGGWSAGK